MRWVGSIGGICDFEIFLRKMTGEGIVRIQEFKARGVFGYLDLSVLFDRNPHILIAPNGAGKTTALRLMQALVTPSLRDLLLIEFLEATLRLNDQGGSDIVILARKNRNTLMLSISNEEGELAIPLGLLEAIEAELPLSRRVQESARALRLKYADDPVYRAISTINMPVFLGLDRRNGAGDEHQVDTMGHDFAYRDYGVRGKQELRVSRESLTVGLWESQRLVQDAYRRVRRLQDMQATRLQKKLLLTGFGYSDFTLEKSESAFEFAREQLSEEDLSQQQQDLLGALKSVGIDTAEAEKELNPFFRKVIALAGRLSRGQEDDNRGEAILEAMLNRASLVRLQQLVKVVRDFNKDTAGLNQKFDSYIKCLNAFFSDSRKEIYIDSVGLFKFIRPGKVEIPPEALSSGERQLLIMFSHLFFNSFGDKSNVFVIDEPEVSLHLRWQEILLGKMVESSPRAQIIVATHSPEIVGELVDHCTSIS